MRRIRDGSPYGAVNRRPTSLYRGSPARNSVATRLTTNDALSYLRDVKSRFQDNKETYDTFLEIMKQFKAQRVNTEGVINQVKSLFKGHRELILGFNTFLPKGFEITMPLEEENGPKTAVEFDQAINYVNKIKTRFVNDERIYKAFLEILSMYRKGQKSIGDVYEEVAILFQSHTDLLEEFTYFLPEAAPSSLPLNPRKLSQRSRLQYNDRSDDRSGVSSSRSRARRNVDLGKELAWFEKLKQRLSNKETYSEFMKVLNLYGMNVITKDELLALVPDVLAKHGDLVNQFEGLMERLELGEFDTDAIFTRLTSSRELRKNSQSDKYGLRPISDMDVSSWERSMVSYVKLPKQYPKLKAGHKTAIGDAVLQDDWVSVTSGSEDYSFKHMRKNQYEEALFFCEDDRFEMDMAIECCKSAITAFKKVQEEMSELSVEDKELFRLDASKIHPVHYRIIQKIYGAMPGERGSEMVQILQKNPMVSLDVILQRLHQKVAEWERDKERMTFMWQKLYDSNYYKSLDHRSFYFKQTDKKNLAQKSMMQEIRELSEKRREASSSEAATMTVKTRFTPDLSLNYEARDVMKILKRAMEDTMSKDTYKQGVRFLDQIVGVLFAEPAETTTTPAVVDVKELSEEHMEVDNPPPEATATCAMAPSSMTPTKDVTVDVDAVASTTATAASPPAAELGATPMEAEVAGPSASTPVLNTGDNNANVEPMVPDVADRCNVTSGPSPIQDDPMDVDVDGDGDAVGGSDGVGNGGGIHVDDTKAEIDADAAPKPNVDNEGDIGVDGDAEGIENDDADEDDEDADEEDDVMSGQCQPLAPTRKVVDAFTLPSCPASGTVLYGNDHLYTFFRLHHHIFDRLLTARKCAVQVSDPGFRSRTEEEQRLASYNLSGPALTVHTEFLSLVDNLIDGTLDSSTFEDMCRSLLGTNAYTLFTLDKLLYKTAKEIMYILGDDPSMRLVDLFRYETSRKMTVVDSIYYENAHHILSEDYVFRLCASPEGTLDITLMDNDKNDVLGQPHRTLKKLPFLRRNLIYPKSLSEEELEVLAAKRVTIVNGLECKVQGPSAKISYVLDTEDSLIKKYVPREKVIRNDPGVLRRKNFSNWLSTKSGHLLPGIQTLNEAQIGQQQINIVNTIPDLGAAL